MTNQEILEKLHEKLGGAISDLEKERLGRICDMLHLMPSANFEKEFPEIVTYLNGASTRLVNDLDAILNRLKEWISKNSASVERNTILTMNKRKRGWLIGFLVVIAIFAVVAVLFTILNLVYDDKFLNGWGEKIASALGTLDFALGALGFILERIDDMKKQEFCNVRQVAKETGDYDKFADMALNLTIKNSFNKTVKIGKIKGDYVSGDKYVTK